MVYNEMTGVVAVGVDKNVKLFDGFTGCCSGVYEMDFGLITAIALDNRFRKLYVGTMDGYVSVYKFNNGALMIELERHVSIKGRKKPEKTINEKVSNEEEEGRIIKNRGKKVKGSGGENNNNDSDDDFMINPSNNNNNRIIEMNAYQNQSSSKQSVNDNGNKEVEKGSEKSVDKIIERKQRDDSLPITSVNYIWYTSSCLSTSWGKMFY
jgi:hypothetical protein